MMSYTPPVGYVLSSNGNYIYNMKVFTYSYDYDIKYGDAIKTVTPVSLNSYSISKEFKYKKETELYVFIKCSNDIVINGNIMSLSGNNSIATIDLSSNDTKYINILIGLNSTYNKGAFDIFFKNGNYLGNVTNMKIYLVSKYNNKYYELGNNNNDKKCIISKYENNKHNDGYMYTTTGCDFTFESSDWDSNALFAEDGMKDVNGNYISSSAPVNYVCEFKLSFAGYSGNVKLNVDVNTD